MSDNVIQLRPEMPEPPQTRLEVNINESTKEFLREYAARHAISVTETVRQLLGVGNYILEAVEGGKQVQLKKGRRTDRVVFDLW